MALHLDTFSDYLVLKPEETKILEILRLLYDGNIGKIDSIICPDDAVVYKAGRRRMIAVSILIQKFFLKFKPETIANIGYMLNVFADNGSLTKLGWNYVSGKVVRPDIDAASYKSLFAFIDTREKLDENIKRCDEKYNAALSIMAAKLAYENEARIRSTVASWNMEFLGFYNCWEDFQSSYCTQVFMLSDKPVTTGTAELILVSFRGTDDPYDASADIDFSWYELPSIGKIHAGFMKALGLQRNDGWPKDITQNPETPFAYYTIREKLREILKTNPNARFILTGHSLGAALAAIFPVILKYHEEDEILERMKGVYTFGQPRVGDKELRDFVERVIDSPKKPRFFRYVYANDIVPRIPFDDDIMLFRHFGTCVYYDSTYTRKEKSEEPNKNYFSLRHFLPKHLNSAFELGRSFVIARKNGDVYKESSVMRFMRVIGLVLPGIAAHCSQDYVNATRLGTLPALPEKTTKSE